MSSHHDEANNHELQENRSVNGALGDDMTHHHDPVLSSSTDGGDEHHSSLLGNDSLNNRVVDDDNPVQPNVLTTNNNNQNLNVSRNDFLMQSLGGQNLSSLLAQFQNNQTNQNNSNNQGGDATQNNNTNTQPTTGRRLEINFRDLAFFAFRILPLVVLPLALLMYWHYTGVLISIWVIITTISSDVKLKEQVSLKTARKIFILLLNGFILAVSIGVMFLFFSQYQIWNFMAYSTTIIDEKDVLVTFLDCLFFVFVVDTIVKFTGMLLKHLIVVILPSFVKPIQVGRILAIVEVFTQLYRISLPPNIWVRYLLGSYNQIFAIIVLVIYGIFKVGGAISLVFDLIITCKNLFSPTCPFGRPVSASELTELGEAECSICLQPFNRPVKLGCNHIYCEQCITEWASSGNQTATQCPVCRTAISGVPSSSKFEKGGTALFCVM
ncbi:hypothetical protein NAEGRDRAFT_80806 [Naegleria gruberi]|uniref:RING-type domain-containing protein n=1 Tax=Naegleria gruberi TaxID=5762 RepID=D2VQ69_NAEGR|nr:uncharacterized protein NAEGRDRAFT_80806 [Naegleria gruberi]EFC41056.1 hypothetical protein NAEGRDRAFT_80806 [Naegleria gruberi]|eukprot:XP_002673800.1 hypothetical protein NAEGRDRAFT_80806 [Naegleria gruberi strain NEG-M]